MKKIFILSVCFLHIFTGCNNKSNRNSRYSEEQIASLHLDSTTILTADADSSITINLNPFLKEQTYDLGALIKGVTLIPLETVDESLLSNIEKIIVADSNIYVHDTYKGGSVAIFDSEGKYISRLLSGPGPEELQRLYDIAFDTENNELVIYQHSFMLFFTPSGQFIRRTRLPFGFMNFTAISGGYVFKALHEQGNEHLRDLEDFTLFVTDKNFKLKSVGMAYPTNYDNLLGSRHNLYDNKRTIIVTQRYTDTVFQYIQENNQLKAKYILDYCDKKIPERYLNGSSKEFESAVKQSDYYFYIGQYHETATHHVFLLKNWYSDLDRSLTVYRDKRTGAMAGGTKFNYSFNELAPVTGFPIASTGDSFIASYLPDTAFNSLLQNSLQLSTKDKELLKNLKDDDNPVLVFYQLKDF